jgi:hypothetical protein
MEADINWIFVAHKSLKSPFPFWRSLLGAWAKVKSGLIRSEPIRFDDILWYPLFGNSLICSDQNLPLGIRVANKGTVMIFCSTLYLVIL